MQLCESQSSRKNPCTLQSLRREPRPHLGLNLLSLRIVQLAATEDGPCHDCIVAFH